MSGVMGLLDDLLSPENRLSSPACRPAESRASLSESPQSPQSPDPDTERRRAKALALLAENPNVRRAVVTETSGDPVIIGIAIRDIGYGELEVRAERYDALALIALLDKHGEPDALGRSAND